MNIVVLNLDISSFDLIRYKNEGLVPCYYDNGFKKFDSPSIKSYEVFGVYLIEKVKYDKLVEFESLINQRIEIELRKIELLKKMVPSVLNDIVK